jgi:hypothetical protein
MHGIQKLQQEYAELSARVLELHRRPGGEIGNRAELAKLQLREQAIVDELRQLGAAPCPCPEHLRQARAH